MYNVDAIIYTKNVINELDNDGFFDPSVDIFLVKDFFYEVLIELVDLAYKETGVLEVTESQLEEAIIKSRGDCFDNIIENLLDKQLIGYSGVMPDGDVIIGLNKEVKIKEKNI